MISIILGASVDVGLDGIDIAFRLTGLSRHGIRRHVALLTPDAIDKRKAIEWHLAGDRWQTVSVGDAWRCPGGDSLTIATVYAEAKRWGVQHNPWINRRQGAPIVSCPGIPQDGSLGQLLLRREVCRHLLAAGNVRALDLPLGVEHGTMDEVDAHGERAIVVPDDGRVTMSGTLPLVGYGLAAIHWLAAIHRCWPTREQQIAATLWHEVDRQADIVRRTTGQDIEVARPGERNYGSQAAARLRASDLGARLPKAAPARNPHRWLLPAEEAVIPEIMSHG